MTSPSSETGPGPILEAFGLALASRWWIVALRGALAIVFGLVAFVVPAATMLSLVVIFAAYAFVDGVFALAAVATAGHAGVSRGLLVLEGVLDILTAIAALAWPELTVVVFVLMVGAWAALTGGLMLGAAFRLHVDHGRWWLALGGVVSIIYGVLLFVAPMIGAVVLTWWIGGYALVFGIALLMLAFRLRGLKAKQA